MSGANYMGGKRNAAKARSKDSTGRIQKGFFGRRRLDMLSKGLASRTHDTAPSSPSQKGGAAISAISFAHAKARAEVGGPGSPVYSYIPGSTRVPSTPGSGMENGAAGVGSSSGSSRRSSRVLDALDTEPLFMRQTLNRILELPDLACLPGRASYRKRSAMRDIGDNKPLKPDRKRQKKSHCDISLSDRESPEHLRDRAVTSAHVSPSHYSSRGTGFLDDLHDSLDEHDNNGYGHFAEALYQRSYTHSPMKGDEAWSTLPHPNPSFHDLSVQSNAPTHPRIRPSQTISSLPPSSEQGSSDYYLSDLRGRHSSPSPAVTNSQDHDALISKTPPPQKLVFSSNNLYEHEDPWHTIGVILGLSPRRSKPNESCSKPVLPACMTAALVSQDHPRTPDSARNPEHCSPHRSRSLDSNISLFDALSYTDSSPTSVQYGTPSSVIHLEEIRSTCRLMKSKKAQVFNSLMQADAPAFGSMLNLTQYDDSEARTPTSPISPVLLPALMDEGTPPSQELEDVRSPFRLFLASKNTAASEQKKDDSGSALNLTGYEDSEPKLLSSASSGRLWKRISDDVCPPAAVDSRSCDDDGMATKNEDELFIRRPLFSSLRTSHEPLGKYATAVTEHVFAEARPTTITSSTVRKSVNEVLNLTPSPPSMVADLDEDPGLFRGPCLFPEDDDDCMEE
ncbi:hypothetical protein FPV67DRAFT_1778839 [Lyophyllum atratum]|nr:hypothetical protein FPV67DRAFT_1778839 [Lyophyllum atratum]